MTQTKSNPDADNNDNTTTAATIDMDNDKAAHHNELHIEYGDKKSPKEDDDEVAEEGEEQREFRRREAAVVFKLDCFIAPVMMLLMLISYLDRGNVSID